MDYVIVFLSLVSVVSFYAKNTHLWDWIHDKWMSELAIFAPCCCENWTPNFLCPVLGLAKFGMEGSHENRTRIGHPTATTSSLALATLALIKLLALQRWWLVRRTAQERVMSIDVDLPHSGFPFPTPHGRFSHNEEIMMLTESLKETSTKKNVTSVYWFFFAPFLAFMMIWPCCQSHR